MTVDQNKDPVWTIIGDGSLNSDVIEILGLLLVGLHDQHRGGKTSVQTTRVESPTEHAYRTREDGQASWHHCLRLVEAGKAPPPVRFGRLVRWSVDSLVKWEALIVERRDGVQQDRRARRPARQRRDNFSGEPRSTVGFGDAEHHAPDQYWKCSG